MIPSRTGFFRDVGLLRLQGICALNPTMYESRTDTQQKIHKNELWLCLFLCWSFAHLHEHAKSLQDVNNLYVISESVKQASGDGGTPMLPSSINKKREAGGRRWRHDENMSQMSRQSSVDERTHLVWLEWRGLED